MGDKGRSGGAPPSAALDAAHEAQRRAQEIFDTDVATSYTFLPTEAWAVHGELTCPVPGATVGNDFPFPRSHGRRHLGTDGFDGDRDRAAGREHLGWSVDGSRSPRGRRRPSCAILEVTGDG